MSKSFAQTKLSLNKGPFFTPRMSPTASTFRPLISVVLPTYNQSSYLEASLRSILAEKRYPIEIIVVDDGSTDNTSDVLARFSEDPHLKIIRQENAGVSAALNTGFSAAKGSFLTWTSSDNRYQPGALEQLADFLLANPMTDLVYANVELIDEYGKAFSNSFYRCPNQAPEKSSVLLLPQEAETLCQINDNFINACFMFRRALRDRVGAYNCDYRGYEDYDYWLRSAVTGRIRHIGEKPPLYQYRLHRNSLTEHLSSDSLSKLQRPLVERTRELKSLLERCLRLELSCCPTLGLDGRIGVTDCLSNAGHWIETESSDSSDQLFSLSIAEPALPEEIVEQYAKALGSWRALTARKLPTTDATLTLCRSTHRRFLAVPRLGAGILLYRRFQQPNGGSKTQKNICPPSGAVLSGAVLSPPLRIPTVLKRARGSSFAAVTPGGESNGTILVLPPDSPSPGSGSAPIDRLRQKHSWVLEVLPRLIELERKYTFVLFCENRNQRCTADSINTAVADNTNLRIIDVSTDINTQTADCSVDSPVESLMFVLSSVDCILSIRGPLFDSSDLLETRIEAGIAASAGISIVVLSNSFPESSSLSIGEIVNNKSRLSEDDLSSLLASLYLPAPHISLLALADLDDMPQKEKERVITGTLEDACLGVPLDSADQYLQTATPEEFGTALVNLLFSDQPCGD